MTAHVSMLTHEEQSVGHPERGVVLEALTAAAGEQERIKDAIIRHEARVHSRISPLRRCSSDSSPLLAEQRQ